MPSEGNPPSPETEAPAASKALSSSASRVLALFRAQGCQREGRGLLWQVIATAAFAQRFNHHAALRDLEERQLLVLRQGQRYVLTTAGEAYLSQSPP